MSERGYFTEHTDCVLAESNRSPFRTISRLPSVRAELGGAIWAQGCNRICETRKEKKGHLAGFVSDSGRFCSQISNVKPTKPFLTLIGRVWE